MRLLHVGLLVADLDRAAAFYEQVLGLARAERPDLGFEGNFYALDGGRQLHLMRLDNPYRDCELPAHGGRDRHLALGVDDLDAVRQRLDAAGVPYTMSRSGRAALFCRDPDGNAVELCGMPAADDWRQAVARLLEECRIGFLSTRGADGPETSMAPYALFGGALLLHLSRLARHTANIAAHPVAGFMICTPETAMDSPLALPRLSLSGGIAPLGEAELAAARQAYLHAVPEAEGLFAFADFALYRLEPAHIHWVGGFGMARDVPLSAWREIAAGRSASTGG